MYSPFCNLTFCVFFSRRVSSLYSLGAAMFVKWISNSNQQMWRFVAQNAVVIVNEKIATYLAVRSGNCVLIMESVVGSTVLNERKSLWFPHGTNECLSASKWLARSGKRNLILSAIQHAHFCLASKELPLKPSKIRCNWKNLPRNLTLNESLERVSCTSFKTASHRCRRWTAEHTCWNPELMSCQQPLAQRYLTLKATIRIEASLLHHFRWYSGLHQKQRQLNSVTYLVCEADEGWLSLPNDSFLLSCISPSLHRYLPFGHKES